MLINSHIFPAMTINNAPNCVKGDTEDFGHFVHSYLTDVLLDEFCSFFGKFCSWKRGASSASAFFGSIYIIGNLISYPKMRRFYTKYIITSMQNMFSKWYFSFAKHPRYSVSAIMNSIYSSYSIVIKRVLLNSFSSGPNPTCFGFFNSVEKPFFERIVNYISLVARTGLNNMGKVNFIHNREYSIGSGLECQALV